MEGEVGVNKQYGINKIFKFVKNTDTNKHIYNDEKNEVISIEEKHLVSVVKIEFTIDCTFLLLCNDVLTLLIMTNMKKLNFVKQKMIMRRIAMFLYMIYQLVMIMY